MVLTMYKYVDYFDLYGRIMQFNKNKAEPIHRWYPFVEGYSKEFIQSIINEQSIDTGVCVEPFSGSGTTALELQNMGIKCISFEINPFMYLLAKVKLQTSYDPSIAMQYFVSIKRRRCQYKNIILSDKFTTLYESDSISKWNLDSDVGVAVEKLKKAISKIDLSIYKDLFTVVLASILLDISNLYRNGKCLSYKDNWESQKYSEKEVFALFDKKFLDIFFSDIKDRKKNTKVNNVDSLYNCDSRVGIAEYVDNNSVDLVITSPPYLNSRDYTDTYMLELKTLGLTKTLADISLLRQSTLRSHVQVKWNDTTELPIDRLNNLLEKLKKSASENDTWNSSILDMIRLYFVDIHTIFKTLYSKLKDGGKIYFNVSNSAYFNILVDTIEIVCDIAKLVGFDIIEIRKARWLNPSPQQKKSIGKLLEAVIVIEKVKKGED